MTRPTSGASSSGSGRRRRRPGRLVSVGDHRPDCTGAPCVGQPRWPPGGGRRGRPARPGAAPSGPRGPRWPGGPSGPPRAPGRRRRAGAGRRPRRSASRGLLRRPTASGAPARAAASSGSTSEATASRMSASPASTPAWRARTGTTSRPAMAEHRGSSSWRTRFRTKRGSSLDGSCTGTEAEQVAQGHRLGPAQREQGMAGPGPHGGQAVDAGAAQQVGQHRLGLVVGGVPGGGVGAEDRPAGRPGPGLEVGAVGRPPPAPSGTRRRTGAAASATTSASAADPGRRPWSTCTAVTRQPAATARTSRASESAPPETPHTSGGPGRRERCSRSSRRPGSGRPSGAGVSRRGRAWHRHARSIPTGCGSRPATAATPGPARPGRGARARPSPRRRR